MYLSFLFPASLDVFKVITYADFHSNFDCPITVNQMGYQPVEKSWYNSSLDAFISQVFISHSASKSIEPNLITSALVFLA